MRNKHSISSELLPGTLEMLILKTLTRGPAHGYGIARHLEALSSDVLQVGESSLYPALQRMKTKGWLATDWRTTDNNRQARYYRLTAAGRKQLAAEREEWERSSSAVNWVLAWSGGGA